VVAAEPASTDDGEVDVMVGVGLMFGLIVNVSGVVIPPPGVGVETVMFAVPGFWISEAGTCTVSVFVFTKIELRLPPFQPTDEEGVKLAPVTVRTNVGWAACMLVGEIALSVGAGKLIVCWQPGRSKARNRTNQKESRIFPRKSLTPDSVRRNAGVKAMVETTKDVLFRQSGCPPALLQKSPWEGTFALAEAVK
jgi:hypothetical protein